VRAYFSPTHPGQSLSPTCPPIALQSFTRTGPFPKEQLNFLPNLAAFSLGKGWLVSHCALGRAPPKNDLFKLAALHRSSLGQSKRACARYFFSPAVGWWQPPASCERCTALLLRSLFGRWRDAMSEGPFGRSPGRTKLAEPSSSGTVRFHVSLKQWLDVQPPPFRGHKD
jgi:hypothetical protein